MNSEFGAGYDVSSKFRDARVMGEEKHLGFARKFAQYGQRSARTSVVEVDENIVQDERNGFVVVEMPFEAGDPQGQKQLIARSVAQSVDRDEHSARTNAFQYRFAFVAFVVAANSDKRTQREPFKNFRRAAHNRSLIHFAVLANLVVEQFVGKLGSSILFNQNGHRCQVLFGFFRRFGSSSRTIHERKLLREATKFVVGRAFLIGCRGKFVLKHS